MAEEVTEIKVETQKIEFEHIEPWIESTGEGDTGLSARLKLKRNFEKISNVIASILETGGLKGMSVDYPEWMPGVPYYAGAMNPEKMIIETSYVWHKGKKWMCLRTLTEEEPGFWSVDWRVVEGNFELTGQITSSRGSTFRGGDVDSMLTMAVWWGDEDLTEQVVARNGTFRWSRRTGYDDATEQFVQQSEDLDWMPTVTGVNRIHLQRRDMGADWMIAYREAMICCEVTFPDGQGGFSASAEYII